MTQKAATMAMKISVVWTMGSGMPIVATAACLLCVVTEEGRPGAAARRGGAAAGVGWAQRAAAMPGCVLAPVTARGGHRRQRKNQELARALHAASARKFSTEQQKALARRQLVAT